MISSCQGAEERSMRISVRNDENILELDSGDDIQHSEYSKNH